MSDSNAPDPRPVEYGLKESTAAGATPAPWRGPLFRLAVRRQLRKKATHEQTHNLGHVMDDAIDDAAAAVVAARPALLAGDGSIVKNILQWIQDHQDLILAVVTALLTLL